jgi:regulator of protease activity HflC (stomatin/prohibitin superfamily)
MYRLRWTSVREDGTYSPHNEVLDYVMLKDHIYLVRVKGAEDADMVPLDVDLFLTMRVTNPYKAIFRVQDWVELVTGRTMPLFRQYVAGNTFKDLKSKTQEAGGEVWQRLDAPTNKRPSLIDEFRTDYGASIKEGGVQMNEVTPPDEYQKAATRRYLAEREREKRMVETIGTVLESLAYSQRKTLEEVQAQVAADTVLQKYFLETAKDMIVRQMGIDGKSYVDIRTSEGAGGLGLEQTLLNLVAAWRRM